MLKSKGVILTPFDILADISQLQFSYYVCLLNTLKWILEGYFVKKMSILGQSSINL